MAISVCCNEIRLLLIFKLERVGCLSWRRPPTAPARSTSFVFVMAAQKECFVLMTVERPRLCYGIKGNFPQTIWMMLLEICHILVKEGNSNKSDICWANETFLLFKNITYVGSSKHFVFVGVFSLSLSAALLSPDDA